MNGGRVQNIRGARCISGRTTRRKLAGVVCGDIHGVYCSVASFCTSRRQDSNGCFAGRAFIKKTKHNLHIRLATHPWGVVGHQPTFPELSASPRGPTLPLLARRPLATMASTSIVDRTGERRRETSRSRKRGPRFSNGAVSLEKQPSTRRGPRFPSRYSVRRSCAKHAWTLASPKLQEDHPSGHPK